MGRRPGDRAAADAEARAEVIAPPSGPPRPRFMRLAAMAGATLAAAYGAAAWRLLRGPEPAAPEVLAWLAAPAAIVSLLAVLFLLEGRRLVRRYAAYSETEARFRRVFEQSPLGKAMAGMDFRFRAVNPALCAMLGYTAEEYVGHHIAEFHADKASIEAILQRLTNRETLRDCEATLRCKDGTLRHALISSNVLWEGDKFIHTRCITRDITERVQSQAQIAILGREAEHRAKNVLATVQAVIELTQADTAEGFKRAIKGRIQSLANAHNLFAQSSCTGAELRTLVAQELSPYCREGDTRA